MSYSTGTQHWPSTQASAPLVTPGANEAQSIPVQNVGSSTILRAHGTRHIPVTSGSQPLPYMSNDRPSSDTNGPQMLPSIPPTFPNPRLPPTLSSSAAPTYVVGTQADPASVHSHVQNPSSLESLTSGVLPFVIGAFDNVVRGRLSAFEESLKNYVDNQKRTNASFISDVNAKMAEGQAAIAKTMDDHALICQQDPGQLMQSVRSSISAWQETAVDHVKGAVKNIGEDFTKKVEPQIDEKKLRTYFSAAGELAITLEEKATEQRNAIELIVNGVQLSNQSLHSRLDSFDARMKSIEDILSTVASNLAASTFTTTQPTVVTSPTIARSPESQISADIPASIVAHESSFASLQTKFTDYISQAEDMMVRLAETTNTAREEAHAGREQLANMVDMSHDMQTAQMKLLHKEISALSAAVGVDASGESTTEEQSTRSSEPAAPDTSESSVSRKLPSLVERVLTLEADQQELMRHFKNATVSSREFADAPPGDKDERTLDTDKCETVGSLAHQMPWDARTMNRNPAATLDEPSPQNSVRLSNPGLSKSRPDGSTSYGAHSSASENPHASRSSSLGQGVRESHPGVSDSEDDYVPLAAKKRPAKRFPDLVCPRPSCGRQFNHIVNLNNHIGRQLCPDLKAAREKEACHSRAPRRPKALRGLGVLKLAGDSRRKKKRKLNDSSAL